MASVNPTSLMFLPFLCTLMACTNALMPMPYPFHLMDDPFRILEQTPFAVPKGAETMALLARADWKETPSAHVMWVDVPGMKKEDIKIEVEENRVVRISGERKSQGEDNEKWHRAERTNGRFWRQFRLPGNADLDNVKAHLQDGVLKITVPKFAEEKKRLPKIVNIAQDSVSGEDINTTKTAH